MALPNLSNSLSVGRLRYIQSVRESAERRNPDTLVRYFLPVRERWRSAWLGRQALAQLRALPFYYYLVARTKYYDSIFTGAVAEGVRRIINVGCGSDTRAHRFERELRRDGVGVLECDQPEAIHAKQETVKRWGADYVEYLPLDLNADGWPKLEAWLRANGGAKVLVLMEGVSPYIDDTSFRRFLSLLSNALPPGSQVAYDFKLRGADDAFGRAGRTRIPFRLSAVKDEVAAFHEDLGFRLEHMELSSELSERLLPGLGRSAAAVFREDGLVRLTVRRHDAAAQPPAAPPRPDPGSTLPR
jgi:methyltransferase (TIGR00027 family)